MSRVKVDRLTTFLEFGLHKIFVLKLPFTATQKINRKELLILLRCF